MPGITQTIPNFNGGISEQPDQLKSPGQVKNIINGLPDITYGLYKRPGSARVGTSKLSGVQNNGSWFHYYRDASEGSYIGQIASDGDVKMWKCSDGSAVTVEWGAAAWQASTLYKVGELVQNDSGKIYECDVEGTSDSSGGPTGTGSDIDDGTARWDYVQTVASAQTSAKSYLSPSAATATEDIQALTINDTTFLNNRTKTVNTTGTTDALPNSGNCAFVEIQRTENGRQYGLNIYNNENLTTFKRATRVRIKSHNQNTSGGTGDCRAIGTQVFAKTDGSKKNLIFRITAQGQAGTTPGANADDSGIDGGGYCCAYSNKITLLHGGYGWAVDDEVDAQMTQAAGGSTVNATTAPTYTVIVEKVEEIKVKGNIKVIRPDPTPFDADTAVTLDSILGGLKTEIDSGSNLEATIIGNGIYINYNTDLNVEVVDNDLMKVIGTEASSIQDLPNQCKDGYMIKISNAERSDEDDIWMKFEGKNGLDGPGSWVECAAPSITKSFDATTMPHIVQRTASGNFVVKKHVWADREVGDDKTNLIPTFADGRSTINRVLFFRNRLTFLSGTNVVCSRAGKLNNFWADTALTVSAADPIDITSSSSFPSDLFDGIEIAAGLLVFSSNQQFLLSSDAEVFNPDTAKLRPVSAFNYNVTIPPISTGVAVGYIDNSGKYSRFNEMINIQREAEPVVGEISKIVPTLLPKDVDLVTNSRENSLILFGKTDDNTVIGYKYFQNGQRRDQSAWFKWQFKNKLIYHFIQDDFYYFLDEDHFLQKLSLVQTDNDPNIDQDSVNYLIHLDNWVTLTNKGTYNNSTNLTTFADATDWIDDVTNGDEKLVIIDTNSNATRVGRYAECTVTNTDDFTVPGDWSGNITLYVGYLYDYQIDLPRLYVTQTQGNLTKADINAYLTLHRVKLNFGKIGLYQTILNRTGKDVYTQTHESPELNTYNIADAPYLEDDVKTIAIYDKNDNVDITVKSSHPAPVVLRSAAWEGDYSQKYYRRV